MNETEGESSYRRYLDGDDGGLLEIIRVYKDSLTLYLSSFTRDMDAAEELCEDTFVKLAVKKPPFRGNSSFKTFLYAIGRNAALDYLKKQKRSVPLDDCADLPDDAESVEAQVIKEERKRMLHRAMKKLSTDYEQALWLRYFEELSDREIAEIMKKSVHAVETLMYRARNALKQELSKEGFVYEEL